MMGMGILRTSNVKMRTGNFCESGHKKLVNCEMQSLRKVHTA